MELLFVDTETGGLDPGRHSLLELAYILYKDGSILLERSFKIKHLEYLVTPEALAVNKINLVQHIKEAVAPRDVVLQLRADLLHFAGKPVLSGHNLWLDKSMIQQLLKQEGHDMDAIISHRMLDTMSLIHTLHFAGKLPDSACSSEGAFAYFGIQNTHPHQALSDVRATVQLFEKLMEMIRA